MEIPQNISDDAALAMESSIIPKHSAPQYHRSYELFEQWKTEKGTQSNSEPVLLAYFRELTRTFSPNTLWTKYSHISSMILLKTGECIGKYVALKKFIARTNEGYEPNKAKILSVAEIGRFVRDGPTNMLVAKVVLLFGYVGAMRKTDLYNLCSNDVTDSGDKIMVNFAETKNKRRRTFYVKGGDKDLNALPLIRNYINLREKATKMSPFFLQVRNGKITHQRVGEKTISKVCEQVATFLRLPDPKLYTSHTMRRSSASAMAEAGVPFLGIKNYVGWKSDRAAHGYIDQSGRQSKDCGEHTWVCSR